ncbi:reverse transcriptase domain-containing protein, partial [Tanacetum coccineum]
MTITRSGMNPESIEELISQRVAEALVAQEPNRNAGLVVESQSQNGDDDDNKNGGNRDHGNNNGDGNRNEGNEGARRNAPVAKAYTYKDFLNCQPRNFSGTEGVVGLARWFEKIELVFRISNCPLNSQKLENELWNLCVKGTDVASYTQQFQELTLLCPRMVPEENDKIKRFIWGLPDNIQVHVYAARSAEQKRKFDNNPQGNRVQQPPFKRQNVAQAFTVDNNEKRRYAGSAPYCNECRLHHEGPCTVKCANCKKVGHMAKDYKTVIAAQTPRAPMANQRVVTCFGCGGQGHYKSDCPKLKNQNRRNKAANNDSHGRAYVITGTFSALIDITPTMLDVIYTVKLANGRMARSDTIIRG